MRRHLVITQVKFRNMEEWPSVDYQRFGNVSNLNKNVSIDFDPYTMMVSRKDDSETISVDAYNSQDIEDVETFCKKYGIVGFNCGRMHPKIALKMLKSKMGIPLQDNVSEIQIKTLLHG